MSKLTVVNILVLALFAMFCGIAIGRYIGLSYFASDGVGLTSSMLIAFPLVKQWTDGHLRFVQWLVVLAVMVVVSSLIHFVIG